MSFAWKRGFARLPRSTETHPHPNRRVGFAQPTRFGGAERCSAKPRLNPLEGEGTKSQYPTAFPSNNSPASAGRLSGPLGRCRATEKLADKGRGLFEGRRPEFRSPRRFRVAQGTGRSPAPYGGVLFLCLLSFCTSQVRRASGAKPAAEQRHRPSASQNQRHPVLSPFCGRPQKPARNTQAPAEPTRPNPLPPSPPHMPHHRPPPAPQVIRHPPPDLP